VTSPPQPNGFACDIDAVEATAGKLDRVLDDLRSSGARDDGYANALASPRRIEPALQKFRDNSSDEREKIAGSVEALARMLHGLVNGVREVDAALAGSLPDVEQIESSPIRDRNSSPAATGGRAP
jgi:hypothetical protein